ncbi:MAG: hypothetical protein ACOYZ6_13175 [Chloroflexota bacterium]
MSKLDSIAPPVTVSPFREMDTGRRLIVLVSDAESDYTPAVHRICELANAIGSRVQFLGLCRDAAEEPRLRRQLVTLSALAQSGNVPAEVRIEFRTDWVAAIKSDLKDSDTVVCFSEQYAGSSHKPLGQILQSNLDVPVTILSGLAPQERSGPHWFKQTLAWTGSLAIVLGFFLLQIHIQPDANDWAQKSLLFISILFEGSLLLAWNSLLG